MWWKNSTLVCCGLLPYFLSLYLFSFLFTSLSLSLLLSISPYLPLPLSLLNIFITSPSPFLSLSISLFHEWKKVSFLKKRKLLVCNRENIFLEMILRRRKKLWKGQGERHRFRNRYFVMFLYGMSQKSRTGTKSFEFSI